MFGAFVVWFNDRAYLSWRPCEDGGCDVCLMAQALLASWIAKALKETGR